MITTQPMRPVPGEKPTFMTSEITGHVLPFAIHTIEWAVNNWNGYLADTAGIHSFYIIWVQSGSGYYQVKNARYELRASTVYCLAPGQLQQIRYAEVIEGYILSFTNEFLNLYENNFDLLFSGGLFYHHPYLPFISINEEAAADMSEIAQKMIKEYQHYNLLRAEILRGILRIFLIYISRQFNHKSINAYQEKKYELVKRFLHLLEKDFATRRMVNDYASALAVTPNYLNEIVKKVSGFPASFHIQQRIVLQAKRQALYADMSMKEIAYDLGFADIAHFSKFFKNVAGTCFSEFRKNSMSKMS